MTRSDSGHFFIELIERNLQNAKRHFNLRRYKASRR